MNISQSEQLFAHAQQLIPGGVNSPVRAFGSVGGTPRFISHGNGAYMWDVDGNRYIDYVLSWGPLVLGHAHPEVITQIAMTAARGTSFGAPSSLEIELASLIIDMMPSIEMIRFVNSGTEACMSALRLARAYTNRTKIIKFAGNYHGHADMLLVQAGSGVATLGLPDSQGVPAKQRKTHSWPNITTLNQLINFLSLTLIKLLQLLSSRSVQTWVLSYPKRTSCNNSSSCVASRERYLFWTK